MPGCACGSAPLPRSTSPISTSTCFAPTVSGPISRKLRVPLWFAGEYGFTSDCRTRYFMGFPPRQQDICRGNDEQREDGAEQQPADDHPADLLARLGARAAG